MNECEHPVENRMQQKDDNGNVIREWCDRCQATLVGGQAQ